MSFSDYWENKILDHIFGKSSYTAPAHIYVGLSLADPGDDGSGLSEPSGGSYVRVETSPSDWTAASGGVIENAVDITFPNPTGNWGLITHCALFDAASGGNFLAGTPLTSSYNVTETSEAPKFIAGDITVTQT